MVGDVNIFLKGTPGDQDFEAEAEIMIAGELIPRNIYTPFYCYLPNPATSGLITTYAVCSITQSQIIAEKDSLAVLCS